MQGSESGGHGAAPISTLCFVPEVVDALKAKGFDEVAILAAGGIADGRQVCVSKCCRMQHLDNICIANTAR